ncbi:ACT domain-containing protein, partial [Staphylococcus aureus]
LELSVLTIHQSIPMEEKATITLSLNAKSKETAVEDVIGALRNLDYVSKVELISMSM